MQYWNHIFHDIRIWFKDTKANKDYYQDEVCRRFESKTEHEYRKSYKDSHVIWDKDYQEYYFKSFHCNIESIGRWNLEYIVQKVA